MFTRKPPPPELVKLNEAIADVYAEMAGFEAHEDEYDAATDQLVKLIKLKKEMVPSNRVSPDTLAAVAANILGIAMIIGYERANVITSKALSFVTKMR